MSKTCPECKKRGLGGEIVKAECDFCNKKKCLHCMTWVDEYYKACPECVKKGKKIWDKMQQHKNELRKLFNQWLTLIRKGTKP